MTQFHVDYYINPDPKSWAEQTLAYAQSLAIPAETQTHGLRLPKLATTPIIQIPIWNAVTGALTFNLNAASTAGVQLSTILPITYQGKNLVSVQVDGTPVSFQQMNVKGIPMGFVTVPAGNHAFTVQYQPSAPTAQRLRPPPP